MSNSIDDFVRGAPGISSATSVAEGEFIHIYEGRLEDSDISTVRIFSLAPDIADQEVHEAFKRTAGQWQNPSTHPNVVTVHDRGTSPRPWLAVEMVDGDRLGEVRADLSMAEIGKIITDSAEAIRNANLYNTIHAALSPDVVWVIRRDNSVVGQIDEWGLDRACRVAAGHNPLSAFSAPELVDGPDNATAQTDIYGLGAIAYYALTGQPPVDAADETIRESLTSGEITPPSQLNPSISTEIDKVILQALSRSPSNRYQSSHDFHSAFVDALPTQEDLERLDLGTSQEEPTNKRDENKSDSGRQPEQSTSISNQTDQNATKRPSRDEMSQSDSTSFLSRRRILAAVGIAGLGAVGWQVAFSDSAQPDVADATPTPTEVPEDNSTPTSTSQSANPADTESTPPSETSPTPTAEQTTSVEEREWVPMFRYDAANTGHKSPGSGPTTYLTEKWVFRTSTGVVSSPSVADGTVYVGANNGYIYAVDKSDGTEQWSYETGDSVQSSPAVVDGTVYIGSNDGTLYALDAVEGFREWGFQATRSVFSSPAVVNGSVYVGDAGGKLYSIDMSDGTEQWSYQTSTQIRISPAVMDGIVYIGTDSGKVHAVNADNGTAQWVFELGRQIRSSPAVVDDTVYIGCHDTNLYALATTTDRIGSNREKWSFETGSRIFSSPAVANGTVFCGSGRTVFAVEASDGTEEWSFTTGGEIRSSPGVGNGTVFVGCDQSGQTAEDSTVYGINTLDGTQTTQFEVPQNIRSSPAIGEETIYIGGSRADLYALTAGY